MSGLKEKAKTYEEIGELIGKANPNNAKNGSEMLRLSKEFDRLHKEKWVRLEDVKEWIRVILSDETLCSYYDCCGIKKLEELLKEMEVEL